MSKPVINVTPLIDVLLVLLIIFMVVTPLKPSSFEAKIPQEPKAAQPVKVHPDTLIVTVNNDSTLRLNTEQPVASVDEPQKLVDRIREIFRRREQNMSSERTIFIKAPKRYEYGSVVKVIDAVKTAGAHPISLQIDNID